MVDGHLREDEGRLFHAVLDMLRIYSNERAPRSKELFNLRLGDDFSPPSSAARLFDGTVVRQPDPVRHVRVRPSHPGQLVADPGEELRL